MNNQEKQIEKDSNLQSINVLSSLLHKITIPNEMNGTHKTVNHLGLTEDEENIIRQRLMEFIAKI